MKFCVGFVVSVVNFFYSRNIVVNFGIEFALELNTNE